MVGVLSGEKATVVGGSSSVRGKSLRPGGGDHGTDRRTHPSALTDTASNLDHPTVVKGSAGKPSNGGSPAVQKTFAEASSFEGKLCHGFSSKVKSWVPIAAMLKKRGELKAGDLEAYFARRKSTPTWLWAAAAGGVLLAMLILLAAWLITR